MIPDMWSHKKNRRWRQRVHSFSCFTHLVKKKPGWWFGCHVWFSHILGMSSSQLTFIFFRWVAQPPTRNQGDDVVWTWPGGTFTQPEWWMSWRRETNHALVVESFWQQLLCAVWSLSFLQTQHQFIYIYRYLQPDICFCCKPYIWHILDSTGNFKLEIYNLIKEKQKLL